MFPYLQILERHGRSASSAQLPLWDYLDDPQNKRAVRDTGPAKPRREFEEKASRDVVKAAGKLKAVTGLGCTLVCCVSISQHSLCCAMNAVSVGGAGLCGTWCAR